MISKKILAINKRKRENDTFLNAFESANSQFLDGNDKDALATLKSELENKKSDETLLAEKIIFDFYIKFGDDCLKKKSFELAIRSYKFASNFSTLQCNRVISRCLKAYREQANYDATAEKEKIKCFEQIIQLLDGQNHSLNKKELDNLRFNSLKGKSDAHLSLNEYEEAISGYNELIDSNMQLRSMSLKLNSVYFLRAHVNLLLGNYYDCIIQSIEIINTFIPKTIISSDLKFCLYNNLGISYFALQQYDDARINFIEASNVANQSNNEVLVNMVNYNLSLLMTKETSQHMFPKYQSHQFFSYLL